jgi:hypothetical protein
MVADKLGFIFHIVLLRLLGTNEVLGRTIRWERIQL